MRRKSFSRLWLDESGSTAVELGLVASFILVPLLLGVGEIGRHIWTGAKLDDAARIGFVFATMQMKANTALNSSNINAAVANASSLPVTVQSTQIIGCPTSTGVVAQASGSACSNGGTTGNYWSVTVTTSYLPLFHACQGFLPTSVCPPTSSQLTLSSSIVFRVS